MRNAVQHSAAHTSHSDRTQHRREQPGFHSCRIADSQHSGVCQQDITHTTLHNTAQCTHNAVQRSEREATTHATLCNAAHSARRDNRTHNAAQCTHRSATGSNTHSAAQCSAVPVSHRRTQCVQRCATQCRTHVTARRDATRIAAQRSTVNASQCERTPLRNIVQ